MCTISRPERRAGTRRSRAVSCNRPLPCTFLQQGLNRSCCWLHTDEYTILNGEVTFMDGQHTGALPGGLVRRQGRRPGVKTGVLPEPPAWSRGESYRPSQLTGADGSTADTALQASLDSESGISNQSRIAEALEKEEAEKKSQAAKL